MIDVPAHWEALRLKTCASNIVEQVPMGGFGGRGLALESVESWTGRIRDTASLDGVVKRFQRGDVLFGKLRPYLAKVARPEEDGVCVGEFLVLRPRGGWFDSTFMAHLMRSKPIIEAVNASTFGARMPRAEWDFIGAMRVPVPPRAQQEAIVRFLDHADRRIRNAIRAKQKLISLLNEQKQAVIHRAVTRGLDPNVRLTPSGADWLGDVPAHWEVLPLRRRWTVTDCKHLTVPFVEEGIPLASVREVQAFELSLAKAKRTTSEWYELLIEGGRQPHIGDLIYCRNVSVGAAAVVTSGEPFAMGQDVCLIRSRSQSQRYLNYFMHSPAMERQLTSLLIGSTFDRINVADIKSLVIAVPPWAEQEAIAAHLDRELASSDAAIGTAREEIDLLREYRARLVADVVTGRLDVRESAARLSDGVDEPEPLDELESDESDESDEWEVDDLEPVEA
jgi:type I restriction enzyme, S subunit